ncbi:hypothetical protein B0570_004442 [Salmonella enterica subsp. enterica serovar Benue]|uniref:hypothetical protein n=1 Tax=Salmonella enterica TaxID=28901 RepID=UPI000F91CD10|nr:hypothetical protein [Salmonella enterica]EDR3562084.1 hypothetical protein [Salmonella enterica subsp. enterica serovar Benue]MIW33671.1 hypothetical protein [Salmonella enterica subsp. enterica serovar Derby]EHS0784549.1 hypothetical protein [Salmonella enterica]MBH0601276.1 hypothetical protein [Salmonella enterica]MBH0654972.1 hypothetical protein [Salmonella enterica]
MSQLSFAEFFNTSGAEVVTPPTIHKMMSADIARKQFVSQKIEPQPKENMAENLIPSLCLSTQVRLLIRFAENEYSTKISTK